MRMFNFSDHRQKRVLVLSSGKSGVIVKSGNGYYTVELDGTGECVMKREPIQRQGISDLPIDQ